MSRERRATGLPTLTFSFQSSPQDAYIVGHIQDVTPFILFHGQRHERLFKQPGRGGFHASTLPRPGPPGELLWVLAKETKIDIINGLVLGLLLGGVAFFWKGNPWLGVVVGGALAANTLVSVILGGMLPLVLKRLKLDPVLVSSPLLTTVTDMCGFFFVLSFAATILPKLGGM